ncbi:hypothetical protein GCM10020221_22440 [Streptomyces thioluteus]|uniref:Secreted protein n=1 Tax=Streptomyces thioluteus TaxID=66431 RepID=A0ABN3WRY0_STRTU
MRTAATAAPLLLLGTALPAASATAADAPPALPLVPAAVRSVRPGDRLTVTARDGEAGNGDVVLSDAFTARGTLRMRAPLLTATVTVACDAAPGDHRVETNLPPAQGGAAHPAFRTTLRVRDADARARRECRDRQRDHPAPADPPEERWPAHTSWPQSPWDVRSFAPGSRVRLTDNEDEGVDDGAVTMISPAFAAAAPARDRGRAVKVAMATISCGTKPGVYPVYRKGPVATGSTKEVWARYRVTEASAGSTACRETAADPGPEHRALPWAVGGGALAVALLGAGGALARVRRTRRRTAGG